MHIESTTIFILYAYIYIQEKMRGSGLTYPLADLDEAEVNDMDIYIYI